MEVENA
nr:hypothetical protein [Scylla paramamosain]